MRTRWKGWVCAMTRNKLEERTQSRIDETHAALAALYDALPPGQQKTVLKNPQVKELLARYGVTEEA